MAKLWDALHRALHGSSAPSARKVEAVVWLLVLASLGLLAAELSLPADALPPPALQRADSIVLLLLGLEIALRVATYRPPEAKMFHLSLAQNVRVQVLGRVKFCLTPLVLIDILSVLALVPALRGLRALRVLRLLKTTRVFRYNNPFAGVVRAFTENAVLFAFAFSVMGAIVITSGVSFYLVEARSNSHVRSVADGLWWAIVTLTTVGFGDVAPVTGVGRWLASATMLFGMLLLALFAGVVGKTLVQTVVGFRQEQFLMMGHVDHIVVFGYESGARVLLPTLETELADTDLPVLLVAPGDRPADVPPRFTWVSGDPTKESELAKTHLTRARAVLVIGHRSQSPQTADALTLLTVFTLRSYLRANEQTFARRRPLYVIAEILDSENVAHAKTAGADEVIESTNLAYSLMSHALFQRGTGSLLSRVASAGAFSLYVGHAPQSITATTFAELSTQLKEAFGILAIGVRDESGVEHVNPPSRMAVGPETQIIYLGEAPKLPGSARGGAMLAALEK